MDKNEIITLSSDEESDSTHTFERKLNTSETIRIELKGTPKNIKSRLEKLKQISVKNSKGIIIHGINKQIEIIKLPKVPEKKPRIITKECPEVVDLEDSEKAVENDEVQLHCTNNKSPKADQTHSNQDVIDIEEIPSENDLPNDSIMEKETITEDVTKNASSCNKLSEGFQTETNTDIASEGSDQSLKLFTEFVEFCGCLEEIPNDRARLTKKLMKRYGEAESSYLKSQEFENLIQKCRVKVNKNNLYLIAKEVTDELSYRKKIEINKFKSNEVEEKFQRPQQTIEESERVEENINKRNRKRAKVINKIIKKLDKLGLKIRELEQKEVDLSDEEESSYVQLQRYRERYCQIYTKLCKYTNEVADAERFYSRKICFTESKYPAINKCIENWLNKTKRFPDFSDIMKLLESQSSSLGLPSNRESIRAIGIEIFQEVGLMLQRRRKYDLWDSFCGFLDEGEDPAVNDPQLDQILKQNYDNRIKKEQEIFQRYVEMQERDRLEAEEVPDEEANHSPVESGNEDDKEIEDIENTLNKRLDDAIEKDTEENGNALRHNESYEGRNDSQREGNLWETRKGGNELKSKESKNNFRNCKSLKWRLENGVKAKSDGVNSEDSTTGLENDREVEGEPAGETNSGKESNIDISSDIEGQSKAKVDGGLDSPAKRKWDLNDGDVIPKKKKCTNNKENEGKNFEVLDMDEESDYLGKKTGEVFEVRCCQIFTDNVFEDFEEKRKDWGKRKVFRDLTNVNRLMELHGKKMTGLFSPTSFFHREFFEFEKPSWRRRFKVNFRLVGSKGQKCAVNQEEKSEKSATSGEGKNEKDIRNNSEGAGDNVGRDNCVSGRGNGSEEDNNGDENKKNRRPEGELNDNQREEDDHEEEEENNEAENESNEHSFPNQKTEKPSDGNSQNETAEPINASEKTPELELNSEKEKEDENKGETPTTEEPVENPDDSKEGSKNESAEVEKCSKPEENEKDNSAQEVNSEIKNKDSTIAKPSTIYEDEKSNLVVEVKDSLSKNEETVEVEEVEKESEKRKDAVNKKADESQPSRQDQKRGNKLVLSEDACESSRRTRFTGGRRAVPRGKEIESVRGKRRRREAVESKQMAIRKPIQIDPPGLKLARRNTPSTSDEERVKRFLLHSPSSISITPPRKLTLSKPPSQAAMQALATLRNLKGISATIVRGGKPKNDEVAVIGESPRRGSDQKSPTNSTKRKRSDLPVISSVQSIDSTTPKIVTVQGNVSGFENPWPEVSDNGNAQYGSSSIRISNVWGSLPNNFMQSVSNNESVTPGCSFRQNKPGSSTAVKKKNAKKTVEYVVLD